MIVLTIHEEGKIPAKRELHVGDYVIGRSERCRIQLRDPSVSERHAILSVCDNECWIEDMNSSNGTAVNSIPVKGRVKIDHSAPVSIGPFTLLISNAEKTVQVEMQKKINASDAPAAINAPPKSLSRPASVPVAIQPVQQMTSMSISQPHSITQTVSPSHPEAVPLMTQADPRPLPPMPTPDPLASQRRDIKTQIHRTLVERLDLKRLTANRIDNEELHQRARDMIEKIVGEVKSKLPPGIDPKELAREIHNEALKLGPLEDLLEDDSITEIMVNGYDRIFVEKRGKLELSGKSFMDEQSVMAIIERIIAPLGRRLDESQPYVDARLADGSRVNAIIHPLSLNGPCITIRKFSKRALIAQDMINYGTFTDDMARFMQICVLMRKNIVVSGGTGSGKTTLLNVLSNYLPHNERILTIEDAAELRLNQPHLVRLEARPPNIEGRGAVTIRDLVRNSLRMRPDRIIVGECRGGEALDMLQAMNTGHDGSLTTVHANAPRDVIARLETMVLMSGMELPSRAIREQIASAVDIVVHESRMSDGSRKVTCISEVVGLEGNQITMQDIFEFRQTGIGEGGKVLGYFTPTGSVPTFFEELAPRGIELDPVMFQPKNRETV